MAMERQREVEDKHVQLSLKSKEQCDFEATFLMKNSKDAKMQNNIQNQQKIADYANEIKQMTLIEHKADKAWVESIKEAYEKDGEDAKNQKRAE